MVGYRNEEQFLGREELSLSHPGPIVLELNRLQNLLKGLPSFSLKYTKWTCIDMHNEWMLGTFCLLVYVCFCIFWVQSGWIPGVFLSSVLWCCVLTDSNSLSNNVLIHDILLYNEVKIWMLTLEEIHLNDWRNFGNAICFGPESMAWIGHCCFSCVKN